jgi:hypothetical protein
MMFGHVDEICRADLPSRITEYRLAEKILKFPCAKILIDEAGPEPRDMVVSLMRRIVSVLLSWGGRYNIAEALLNGKF